MPAILRCTASTGVPGHRRYESSAVAGRRAWGGSPRGDEWLRADLRVAVDGDDLSECERHDAERPLDGGQADVAGVEEAVAVPKRLELLLPHRPLELTQLASGDVRLRHHA